MNTSALSNRLLQSIFVSSAQSTSQLIGEALIALLAYRLFIVLVKFGLLVHFVVTNRARKVVHTPGLVQSGENVTSNNLVADETQVTKQLMVMGFAVC